MRQPISVDKEMQGRCTRLRMMKPRKGKSSVKRDVGLHKPHKEHGYHRAHFNCEELSPLFKQEANVKDVT